MRSRIMVFRGICLYIGMNYKFKIKFLLLLVICSFLVCLGWCAG